MDIKGKRDWDKLYGDESPENMPWFLEGIDHDLEEAISTLYLKSGKALDIGTGPGTQAIALSKLGFSVTAIDISANAVLKARQRAKAQGSDIEFMECDAVKDCAPLQGAKFDFAFDRGCFHVLEPDERQAYVANIGALIKPNGFLLLKTFSSKEPGEEGPHRFKPVEIEKIFTPSFKVIAFRETEFAGQRKPNPKALFFILKKT